MCSVSILTTPVRLALARLVVLALALGTAATALVLSAAPASAHAALQSSSPADGSTITAAPPEVALRFNEPIGTVGAQVQVTSGGTSATQGEPSVEGSTVSQPLAGSMEQGDYTITYRVVSADGHPVSGTVDFTYAVGGAAGSTEDEADASTTTSTGSGTGSTSASGSTPSSEATSTSSPDGSASPTSGDSSSGSSEAETTSASPTESTTGSNTASPTTDAANTADDDEGNDTSRFPLWGYGVLGVLALGVLGFGVRSMSRSSRDEKVAIKEYREEHAEDRDDLR